MALRGATPSGRERWRGQIRGWLGFLHQFVLLAGPFWRSEEAWRVNLLTLTLVLLTIGQVAVAVILNAWLERVFTALEDRAFGQFALHSSMFFLIAAGNAAIVTAHLWVKRRLQIRWREWLTGRLLREWMAAGRHYQISLLSGEHDNPDGRIAEDVRISTEYAIDLAHSLLYCALLLVSFTQILWTLSGPPEFAVAGFTLYVPGHLVWIALAYAAVGAWLALWLGFPLIRTANARQTAEADFRFGLAHARESAPAIALLHGEAEERRRFYGLFASAIRAWNRQTLALCNMFLFSSSWSVLSQIFPVFVAAPRYIAGAITLGVLMQTAQAFQQLAAALAWPIDNFARAAEWRASVERVQGLHRAIVGMKAGAAAVADQRLEIVPGERPVLAFADCAIDEPDGQPAIHAFSAEIEAGERVLISGRLDIAVKLFKAVAGAWPWGRGRIELPAGNRLFFLPQRPYLPAGPLRQAICYPSAPEAFGDAAIRQALQRVELGPLADRLDEHEIWEQQLTLSQQQRIGFARLLLHRPSWIFLQEAADALEPAGQVRLFEHLFEDFPKATVVSIDEPALLAGLHRRFFTLIETDGATMIREERHGQGAALAD